MKEQELLKGQARKWVMAFVIGLLAALLAIGLLVPRLGFGGSREFKFLDGNRPDRLADLYVELGPSTVFEEQEYTLEQDFSVVQKEANTELPGLGYLNVSGTWTVSEIAPGNYTTWANGNSTVSIMQDSSRPHRTRVALFHPVPNDLWHRLPMWLEQIRL